MNILLPKIATIVWLSERMGVSWTVLDIFTHEKYSIYVLFFYFFFKSNQKERIVPPKINHTKPFQRIKTRYGLN